MGCCGGVSSARLHGRHTLAQSERLKLQLASGPDDETVHVGQQSTSLHQGVCGMYSRCSPAIHSLGYPCTDLSSLNNSEKAFDDPSSATGGVQRISIGPTGSRTGTGSSRARLGASWGPGYVVSIRPPHFARSHWPFIYEMCRGTQLSIIKYVRKRPPGILLFENVLKIIAKRKVHTSRHSAF